MRAASLLRRGLAALALLMFAGCVYDHRVTQAILERRRRAAAAEGARIRPAQSIQSVRYQGQVRFYVAADYRRQHGNWRAPLRDLVDAANSVLGPAFAVRLEETRIEPWDPSCDREQLAACLKELAEQDAGDDGAWVVGLLGDNPRFTSSFEHLGMAHSVSSHMVLRDVSDLAEREAIERAFASHTPGRRAEIYTRRKQHKRLAVFLHEWAHTLGGLHVDERNDLLHPSYDDQMRAFGDANAGLISAGLEDRFASGAENRALLNYVARVEPARFLAHEHERLLSRLEARHASPGARSTSTSPAPESAAFAAASRDHPAELAELTPPDRAAFLRASQAAEAGRASAAWQSLQPLIERNTHSQPVQRLACSLSMQRGDAAAAQAACTRVQQATAAAR